MVCPKKLLAVVSTYYCDLLSYGVLDREAKLVKEIAKDLLAPA